MSTMSEEISQISYHISIKQSAKGFFYLGTVSVTGIDLDGVKVDLDKATEIGVSKINELNGDRSE